MAPSKPTIILLAALLAALLFPAAVLAGNHGGMTVAFADPQWGGEDIPPGQQCAKCGGNGATPRFVVKNIPAQAVFVDILFRDGHAQSGMTRAGDHGAIRVLVTDHREMTTPAVLGGSADLPEGVQELKKQKCGQCGPQTAYLPPCACLASFPGKHKYYALIRAVDAEENDLAEVEVMIGAFR